MHPVPPDWALKGAGTNRVQEDEDKHPDRKGKEINKDGNNNNDSYHSFSLFIPHIYCEQTRIKNDDVIMS